VRGEGGYRLLSRDYARYEEGIAEVLAFQGFDVAYLQRMRRMAYLGLYLRNGRYLELAAMLVAHRRSLARLLWGAIAGRRRGGTGAAFNTLSWPTPALPQGPPPA
jgi:hypothetical protein